ncbi:MAG: DUF4065 domain-containing protein [Candidatus Gottesmanbacteria bacterium]|nr:DUF4065 domain-containing protein [Candidatus Gottesmanbacteria bacterium]
MIIKTPFSASLVAKFFIWKASTEGKTITNKKLQKLLYYAQAWYLALKDRPLFKEDIQAWVHGPAIPSIYDQYRKFGYENINVIIDPKEIASLKTDDLLNEVWKVYGKFEAEYLETLTHNEEPWQLAREGLSAGDASTNIISKKEMKKYFKSLKHA